MTDDFPRDRTENPADSDDDLHEGELPPAAEGDESYPETGLEDRNADVDVDADADEVGI